MLSCETNPFNPYKNFCEKTLTTEKNQTINSSIDAYCETITTADKTKTKKFLQDVLCKALFYDHVLFLKDQSPECKAFEKNKEAFKDITHQCYDAGYSADELTALAYLVTQSANRTEVRKNFSAKIHRYDGKYTRSPAPLGISEKVDLLQKFIKTTQSLEVSFNKVKSLEVNYKDRNGSDTPFQYDYFRMGKKGIKAFPDYVGFFKFVKKNWKSKDPESDGVKQHVKFLSSQFQSLVANDDISKKVFNKMTSVDDKNAKKAAKTKAKTNVV